MMKDFYRGKCVTCRFWDPLHDVSKYEGPSLEMIPGLGREAISGSVTV